MDAVSQQTQHNLYIYDGKHMWTHVGTRAQLVYINTPSTGMGSLLTRKNCLMTFNKRLLFLAAFFLVTIPWFSCENKERDAGPPGDELGSDETLVGMVRIRILDSESGSVKQHLLITKEGRRVILRFGEIPRLVTGENVQVSGVSYDDGKFDVATLKHLDRTLRRLDAPLVRSPMVHRAAILAMKEATVSEQAALEAFHGRTDSLQHFYEEVTHGVDTFTNAIFRRYEIAYAQDNCLWDNAYKISDALIEAFEREGNRASDYDHIICIVPENCGTDWDGAWADVGGISDKGALDFRLISMYKDYAFDPWYLAHELGHNLGMNHSRSIDCGTDYYKKGAEGCAIKEYGNYNDLMGWGEGVYFSTAYQRYLGWIGASNVVTAAKDGVFNLQPADGKICGIRALRIPIPGENGSYFYLEYRRARPDSHYAGTGSFGGSRTSPVLLSVSRDGTIDYSSSYVDRVELGTDHYDGAALGKRYELGEGVAITVLDRGSASARVSVEMSGTGIHRTDDGSAAVVETDGSIGPLHCDEGSDTDTDLDTDTDVDTNGDSGGDSGIFTDTEFPGDSGVAEGPYGNGFYGNWSCGVYSPASETNRSILRSFLRVFF